MITTISSKSGGQRTFVILQKHRISARYVFLRSGQIFSGRVVCFLNYADGFSPVKLCFLNCPMKAQTFRYCFCLIFHFRTGLTGLRPRTAAFCGGAVLRLYCRHRTGPTGLRPRTAAFCGAAVLRLYCRHRTGPTGLRPRTVSSSRVLALR